MTKRVKASKKAQAKRMTVAVASRGATLRGGATQTFTLRLNAAGQALVAHVDSVAVRVKVSSGGKTIRTATVTVLKHFKAKKKKRKKKKG